MRTREETGCVFQHSTRAARYLMCAVLADAMHFMIYFHSCLINFALAYSGQGQRVESCDFLGIVEEVTNLPTISS